MNADATTPKVLLVHDGELEDVRALLADLGAPCVERRGGQHPEDRGTPWQLVVASPKRLLSLHLDPAVEEPTQIAVLAQDSRTLRNSLRRAGIHMMVRRPVHSATLRAVLVHALYCGPEKRRTRRVNVGAAVRLRVGWRQRQAMLVDLSLGGCRLQTEQRHEPGTTLSLQLPTEIAGGKAFRLKARVLRSDPEHGRTGARFVTTARFEKAGKRQHAKLSAAVAAHADGPAVCTAPAPPALAGTPPLAATPPAVGSPPPEAPEPAARELRPAEERRAAPRRPLDRRVVALSEEATRVLMGRDITIGGMRVNSHPDLEVGADLLLAVHTAAQDTPLVIRARVHRDDGERGMVLRFHELSPDASRVLNAAMDQLPLIDEDEAEDGSGGECLVTEILETG